MSIHDCKFDCRQRQAINRARQLPINHKILTRKTNHQKYMWWLFLLELRFHMLISNSLELAFVTLGSNGKLGKIGAQAVLVFL